MISFVMKFAVFQCQVGLFKWQICGSQHGPTSSTSLSPSQFSVPQIEYPLDRSSKKCSHVYFLLQVFWVILLFCQIVLLFDINVTMVTWCHNSTIWCHNSSTMTTINRKYACLHSLLLLPCAYFIWGNQNSTTLPSLFGLVVDARFCCWHLLTTQTIVDNCVDWLIINVFLVHMGRHVWKWKLAVSHWNVWGGGLLFLSCTWKKIVWAFFDILEHYHWAFQKESSLRWGINIKFVRMCYAILNYTVKL